MAEAAAPLEESSDPSLGGNDEQLKACEATSSEPEEVTHSVFKNGRYKNPWDTWEELSVKKLVKWMLFDKSKMNIPSAVKLDTTLPVVDVNYKELRGPLPPDCLRVVWIGHASTLVQFDGITFLTDPIFSQTCGPKGMIGRSRFRPCPVTVNNLPKIDAVFISHNHYDHLDEHTVIELNERFGDSLRWFVPLGLKKWFCDTGCENIVEMDWWQESCLGDHPEILVAFTPGQHWSRRTVRDYCKTLWGSWVIKGPSASYYFAGDTGYCNGFKEIGDRYGPFTLAALPIGAYEPIWFKRAMHMSPEEAAQVHVDVRAQKSLGIHWGTFCLGSEFYLDPPKAARLGMEKLGLDPEDFYILHHGEARVIESMNS